MMGRLFDGVAIGAFTVAVPMLISESVPSELRDACVSCFQFMITLGILIGNAVCYGFRHSTTNRGYQVPIGIGFIFAFILFLALLVLPESPRYLASVDRIEDAHKALGRTVRMSPSSSYIVNEMRDILNTVENDKAEGDASWSEIFTGKPKIFYRVIVGIMVLSLQQLCGANYFFYYGTSLFKSIGSNDSFATAMILSGVNCGCTVLARLAVGRAMIFFACLFIFGFAVSWAPLAYVVAAEIYPQRIRSKGLSLATGTMWLWNFCISFFTPMITGSIGYKYGYVFSGCVLFSLFFTYFCVHETQGVTLEEINDMYGSGVSAWQSAKHVKEIHAMHMEKLHDIRPHNV
ncbi:hypothetical protein D0Z03_000262 [Geotrichum reessii]|nr:hypothetical protein D0Z03_000262 [Galactomyces reessii]